jgi:hypothetical protein
VTGCVVPQCPDTSVVVVTDAWGDRAAVCRWHWEDMPRAPRARAIWADALAPAQLELW